MPPPSRRPCAASRLALRAVAAIAVACVAAGTAYGQAAPPTASEWIITPECGPARPGCKLTPPVRRQVERQIRLEALRQQSSPPLTTDRSAPSQRALPLPTPAEQILPEHRERSIVRPEFLAAGQPIRKAD